MTAPAKPLTIAVGGFMHETNTFARTPTGLADFERTAQFPGLCRAQAMLDSLRGRNMAAACFIQAAEAAGHTILPLAWTFAQPGGTVTSQAFEAIAAMLIEPLTRHQPDAVFLELHGAAVIDRYEDGEGELLARVRAVAGPDVPILCTLDLHGNISPGSVAIANYMTAYREYPHTDWGLAGTRAARDLPRVMAWGKARAFAHRRYDWIIPVTAQTTYAEPARGLYRTLARLEEKYGVALSLMMGFPPADIADCGPCVFGYGGDQVQLDAAVDALMEALRAAEPAFAAHPVLSAEAAVSQACAIAATAARPVIIADTEDNPGAGSTSCTTGMARELIRQQAQNAIIANCHEPEIAARAHLAGIGAVIEAVLGQGAQGPGQQPLVGRFKVVALSDGNFIGAGPMAGGMPNALGPAAVIETGGVQLLLTTTRQQPISRSLFEHLGIDPAKKAILVLKSSVHFRNHYEEIAEAILVASSPGINPADPSSMAYTRLPAFMRLKPGQRA